MEKRVKPKDELLKEKEQILNSLAKTHSRSKKMPLLTKAERKILGIGKDEGKAIVKYIRISSSKVKIVLDLIRNKSLDEAYGIVKNTPKAASEVLYKLLKSAEANAVNKEDGTGLDKEKLYVAEVYTSQGPTLKRFRPRAQGRATRIRKRTSHITMVLKER